MPTGLRLIIKASPFWAATAGGINICGHIDKVLVTAKYG
jgi:hypothetical protein